MAAVTSPGAVRPGRQAGLARDVAGSVLARLADPGILQAAIAASDAQTTLPATVGWRGHTLAAGFAGTALLFAAADTCWPDTGWDAVGHRHLRAACSALEAAPRAGMSLYGGLAGVGYAAVALAAGRDRYARLLRSVDAALLPQVVRAVQSLADVDGCPVGAFDLISGLTGVGVYLLGRRSDPDAREVLELLLAGLAGLLADQGEPRRWHTPAGAVGNTMSRHYPHGNHNCGLAHGLPGPLALLSIALREGVAVPGGRPAIEVAAGWLVEHQAATRYGPDWPNAVGLPAPLGAGRPAAVPEAAPAVARDAAPAATPVRAAVAVQAASPVQVPAPAGAATAVRAGASQPADPARAAWCYGAPGVARALWLAGSALGDATCRELAVDTIRGVLARPPEQRGLTSPTFCHGTAGLLQVVLRFAADTGRPEFATGVDDLVTELLAAHEPGSLLGYRNVEPGPVRVDQPGLLTGAPGVALTLLAAGSAADPGWDRAFLLS
jgi:hypothetical protein